MNGTEEIGCCGAYCKTCREFLKICKGCKLGYLDGSRDLRKTRCKMKICCLTKGHATCADCTEYACCETIQRFVQHPGYKYSKYRQALEFIRAQGYQAFLAVAQNWKNAYGKYDSLELPWGRQFLLSSHLVCFPSHRQEFLMKYLNRVRKPETHSTLQSKLLMIAGALLLGMCLGTFSKYLDYRQTALPGILQQIDASLDLHNFLGAFAPWIVIAVFLSIKSPSPFQASAAVFAFFVGMVASYYLYSNYVAGFFPKSYAMIWVGFTLLSPIPAFFCWYAKGTGWLAIVISAGILGFLINCTLAYGMWYVDLRSALHLVTLILGILMLRRRSGTETLLVIGLSIPAAIFLNLLIPFYF